MASRKQASQADEQRERFFRPTFRSILELRVALIPENLSIQAGRGSKAIQLLQWWNIPRRGWIIILGELVVIISLASGIYSEYVNNAYFQSYVNSLSPILVPIVSVGFGLASATIATLLYFTLRNTKQTQGLRDESLARRRVPQKKMIRKVQVASPRSEQPSEEPGARSRSKLQPVGSYLPKRTPGQSGRDQDDDSE